MKIKEELLDFIDSAEKNRKYPRGTAAGRRSALKLFADELNEEEAESLDKFKQNLGKIYAEVFNKHKANMTIRSLETYKSRVQSLVDDFEEYGLEPSKFANWDRKVRKVTRKVKSKTANPTANDSEAESEDTLGSIDSSVPSRFELPLRPGIKAIVLVPSDVKKSEVKKIFGYLNYLETIAEDD